MNNPFTWDEYKTWRALNIEEQYPDAKSKYKKGEVKSVQVRCGGGCRAIPIILIKFAFIKIYPGDYGWQILWSVLRDKKIIFLTEKDIDNRMNYKFEDPYDRIALDIKFPNLRGE